MSRFWPVGFRVAVFSGAYFSDRTTYHTSVVLYVMKEECLFVLFISQFNVGIHTSAVSTRFTLVTTGDPPQALRPGMRCVCRSVTGASEARQRRTVSEFISVLPLVNRSKDAPGAPTFTRDGWWEEEGGGGGGYYLMSHCGCFTPYHFCEPDVKLD